MTIPNLITSLRIVLVPILVIYLLDGRLLPALVVFVIAGLSDGVDGFLARVFNQKSRLGSFLDPLADKILLVATFIVLAVRDFLPAWLSVVVISRDVLILLGVLILSLYRGNFLIRPSMLSKLTTCFQLFTVFAVLSEEMIHLLSYTGDLLLWTTAALTIGSGLHYMHFWFRTMGEEGVIS